MVARGIADSDKLAVERVELRRLHDVVGGDADESLQGGDGRRGPHGSREHVRHDGHPGLHRVVLQRRAEQGDDWSSIASARRSRSWTT